MALPKIDTPTYELTLPLSKKKIKYRPFLVKEQKNLLMALESKETETIQRAIRDILTNCTITENILIDSLPILDVEYYFIQLRAKSVGEMVEVRYLCNNFVEEKECGNVMQSEIDVTKVELRKEKDIEDVIQLTDTISMKLKYPEFAFIDRAQEYENVSDMTFSMIAKSVEYVYDGEQFYYANEVKEKELVEYIENLSPSQFSKIEEFFGNLPRLEQNIDVTCNKCGFNHNIVVEGLESFFI